MSDKELWGGSIHSTRSSVYKLKVEWSNIEGLKNRPTVGYISVLAFTYCRQAKDLL